MGLVMVGTVWPEAPMVTQMTGNALALFPKQNRFRTLRRPNPFQPAAFAVRVKSHMRLFMIRIAYQFVAHGKTSLVVPNPSVLNSALFRQTSSEQ